jgi:hypothetical protein
MNKTGAEAQAMNRLVIDMLRTKEGSDKVASELGGFVRTKLRERSFAEKILPPERITDGELQYNPTETSGVLPAGGTGSEDQEDTPFVMREIEPDAMALAMNFQGTPDARYITSKRYFIPIGMWSSERLEKSEQELAATTYDITKVIENQSVKEIDTQKDTLFLSYVDAALTETGKVIAASGPVTRNHLAKLQQPIIKDQIPPKVYLLSDMTFTNLLEWDSNDLGDDIKEVTVGGYTYTSILGMLFVRSIKSDMFDTFNADGTLATGKIYCFTGPDFLGHSFLWGDTKVWSQWEANQFSFQVWENGGMGLGNINGISRLDLTYA